MSGSGFPQIEINKMHISQSIEVKPQTRPPVQGGSGGGAWVNEVQHRTQLE